MSKTDGKKPKETFEALEQELTETTAKLEDADVSLADRLQLHARAMDIHKRLEAILEAARKAMEEEAPAKASSKADEPYEAVRDRLAEVVEQLEDEDLPLARVVELHGEARVLAARCEAILKGAEKQLEEIAPAEETTEAEDTASEEGSDNVPF